MSDAPKNNDSALAAELRKLADGYFGPKKDYLHDLLTRAADALAARSCVFEVVDATDDERYYHLGIFLTEDDAMSLLDGAEPPWDDGENDAVVLEVRKLNVGFHPHQSDVIASRQWTKQWGDEEFDVPKWKVWEIKRP